MSEDAEFVLHLPAEATAPAHARRALRRWLTGVGWPVEAAEDLVLAASEAVSNSVEHGYRRTARRPATEAVRMQAAIQAYGVARVLRMTIADDGEWRDPPSHAEGRRQGLSLIRAVVADLQLHHDAGGTRITLQSCPVPAEKPYRS